MKLKINHYLQCGFWLFLINFCLVEKTNAQIANYSGDWKINYSRSDFGKLPASFAANEIIISQDSKTISISRTVIKGDSTAKTEESLNFDGTVKSFDLKDRKKTASIKWSPGKGSIIETAEITGLTPDGKETHYQSIETFTLSQDSMDINFTRQVISDNVNFTIKAMYIKQ